MKEKKQIKISLGTAICIFIIIILLATMAGTIVYYNSKNEIANFEEENKKENNAQENTIGEIEENEKVEEEQDEVLEDIVDVKELYVFSNGSVDQKYKETKSDFIKIGFSHDNKFLIETYDFTVTGEYETIDENNKKCKIEKYTFDSPYGSETHLLKQKEWVIDFEIVNDKKIKVASNNINSESEIGIVLSKDFSTDYEFTTYNVKDFRGSWNTKYAYYCDEVAQRYDKKDDLKSIFGTSFLRVGSKITFEEDASFEDYVYPVTEGDMYRKGTYTFKNGNEISLEYTDGNKEVKIYIIDENTLAYHDGNYIMILQREQ